MPGWIVSVKVFVASKLPLESNRSNRYTTEPVGAGIVTVHVSPPLTAVQFPPLVDRLTVAGLTGTCVLVGALPSTVITVIFIVAEFEETKRAERSADCVPVRGTMIVSVAVCPESGVVVAGADVGGWDAGPPPPPVHAATPLAMTMTEPATSARMFMNRHLYRASHRRKRAAARRNQRLFRGRGAKPS